MNPVEIVSALLGIAAVIYLAVALLAPERF